MSQSPLSTEQLKHYYEEGYLLIEDFYSEEQMDAVQKSIEGILDQLAKDLFADGKIQSTYSNLDWTQRLLAMNKDFPDATVILHKSGFLPESMYNLFTDDKILQIAESLGCGPDLCLSPIWNLRGKLPAHEETVVPWH